MDEAPQLLGVATVVKPHGVRGGVKLRCSAECFALLGAADRVWVGGVERPLVRLQGTPTTAIGYFEGIDDRSAAEALRGQLVELERGELPELGSDEYYIGDLIGCAVRDQHGRDVGSVVDARPLPANVVAEVALIGGAESVLIPVTREAVPELDLTARVLTIDSEFLGIDHDA